MRKELKHFVREAENMSEEASPDVMCTEAPLDPTDDQGEHVESIETPLEPPCEQYIWLLVAIRI